MTIRTHSAATPMLVAAATAIALILYGAGRYPSSLTDAGLATFLAAGAPLLVYFSAAMWARRSSARIQAALRIGTVAGFAIAAVGVLYHIIEISTSLPVSMSAVLGGGMWGVMFLAFGSACSATFTKEKSIGIAILSSVWCGMIYASVLVACALAIGFTFMPHMQRIVAPLPSANGVQASQAFVVRHEIGAAGEHLLLVPVIATFVGSISSVACLLLVSMRRQTALVISSAALLVFAAGVASIRFASHLERSQRPPFVAFGLASLALTLASAHPLFVATRSPHSPTKSGC